MFFNVPLTPDPALAICQYDLPQPETQEELAGAVANETCASIVLESTPVLSRCFPNPSSEFNNSDFLNTIENSLVQMLNSRGFSFEIQRDLYAAWPVLLMLPFSSLRECLFLIPKQAELS